MARKRNWAPLAGLLLGVAGVISYFTLVNRYVAPRYPWFRDSAALNLAVLAAALFLSFLGVRRALSPGGTGRRTAAVLAALNFGIAGFFLYYLVGYSSKLPAAASSPKVGTVAPDFTLRDHTGREVTLSSFRGRNVLLVFYRGHW